MIKAVAFDLDGTLYCGENAIDGAVDAVISLRRSNYRVFYFTNNSAKTRRQIVDKLHRLGFPAKLRNTYCTSYALLTYLLENNLKTVYLIGSDDLKSELSARGIRVENSSQAPVVVVGLDPLFDYHKIVTALEAINNGASLIVANADPAYPTANGKSLPGCGAMVGAIVGATSHSPDFMVGKPHTYMFELLCREHNLAPAEICVVGDSPASDMKMAASWRSWGVLFDPQNVFPLYDGDKIKHLQDIFPVIQKVNQKGA